MYASPRENRFAIVLMLAATSSLAACHPRVTSREVSSIEGIRFGARASIVGGDTLRVTATAESISNQPLEEYWSSCAPLSNLAITAAGNSRIWDSRKWEYARLPIVRDSAGRPTLPICVGGEVMTQIRAGGLAKYGISVPINQILGDSLPPGKYKITARIDINYKEVINIPAGVVELRR